jgi:hypothetical protein
LNNSVEVQVCERGVVCVLCVLKRQMCRAE